jgi:hypothetical protein
VVWLCKQLTLVQATSLVASLEVLSKTVACRSNRLMSIPDVQTLDDRIESPGFKAKMPESVRTDTRERAAVDEIVRKVDADPDLKDATKAAVREMVLHDHPTVWRTDDGPNIDLDVQVNSKHADYPVPKPTSGERMQSEIPPNGQDVGNTPPLMQSAPVASRETHHGHELEARQEDDRPRTTRSQERGGARQDRRFMSKDHMGNWHYEGILDYHRSRVGRPDDPYYGRELGNMKNMSGGELSARAAEAVGRQDYDLADALNAEVAKRCKIRARASERAERRSEPVPPKQRQKSQPPRVLPSVPDGKDQRIKPPQTTTQRRLMSERRFTDDLDSRIAAAENRDAPYHGWQTRCAFLIHELVESDMVPAKEVARTLLAPAEHYRSELVLVAGMTVSKD